MYNTIKNEVVEYDDGSKRGVLSEYIIILINFNDNK